MILAFSPGTDHVGRSSMRSSVHSTESPAAFSISASTLTRKRSLTGVASISPFQRAVRSPGRLTSPPVVTSS